MPKGQHRWTYYEKYIHLYSFTIYLPLLFFFFNSSLFFYGPVGCYSNYWQAIVMDDIVTI